MALISEKRYLRGIIRNHLCGTSNYVPFCNQITKRNWYGSAIYFRPSPTKMELLDSAFRGSNKREKLKSQVN